MIAFVRICWVLAGLVALGRASVSRNSTYFNPVLSGWHSDPSCVFVPEKDNTFFCATSTFLVFPGLPIYASKDLLNWKLVSNALNRPTQLPELAGPTRQSDGIYAPTIRYHDGVFYVITVHIASNVDNGTKLVLFKTTDPYDDASWSDPIVVPAAAYDPDLFWDDDGTVYLTSAGTVLQTIDLSTGETSNAKNIWNGTGGAWPEGPHMYKKDGYYYLMIGEGGTELNHSETIARSKDIWGPYTSYSGNPILTNRGTDEYFQTVGHADLFQDAKGNWWGVALSTRSGLKWVNYPMGRETVLFPVTWKKGDWPICEPVRGEMSGWPLPHKDKHIPGDGAFNNEPDVVDFQPSSSLPNHFVHWRLPDPKAYQISPPGPPHPPNSLRLTPSRANLTGPDPANEPSVITLVMRRQTDTLFTYNVDVDFKPRAEEEEAGVTVFLTQYQHIDLAIALLRSQADPSKLIPQFRFRATGTEKDHPLPETKLTPIPPQWMGAPIQLQIQAVNDTHYAFAAASAQDRNRNQVLGYAPATIVSGGEGPFTGALVGAFATTNGGHGDTCAYISRWRYNGGGQKIDYDVII